MDQFDRAAATESELGRTIQRSQAIPSEDELDDTARTQTAAARAGPHCTPVQNTHTKSTHELNRTRLRAATRKCRRTPRHRSRSASVTNHSWYPGAWGVGCAGAVRTSADIRLGPEPAGARISEWNICGLASAPYANGTHTARRFEDRVSQGADVLSTAPNGASRATAWCSPCTIVARLPAR